MEKAALISNLDNLSLITPKHQRLYFGPEFCQHLLPSPPELKEALNFARQRRLSFTLVTPFVTEEGLKKLIPLWEVLKDWQKSEVVVNDWGVLYFLRENYPEFFLVLGRLLSKQKRGPRLLNIKDKIPQEMWNHFQRSYLDLPLVRNFLFQKGIRRVELDNLLQGIKGDPRIPASLYYPYTYVTTTRMCLTNACDQRTQPLRSIFPCRKECSIYTFKLTHRNMPLPLFIKGNTQFFKNEEIPSHLSELGIDRLVQEVEYESNFHSAQ
ncbi:MAG TPA: hypothetical protein ENH97_02070 [bacterium]|nr:hypothetical protein [bacterium]